MKNKLILLGMMAGSVTALAGNEGTYRCKNQAGLPDSVHIVKMVEVTPGSRLPFVDSTRPYRESSHTKVKVSRVTGFATVVSDEEGQQTWLLGASEFEFRDGKLANCRFEEVK